MLEIFFGLIMIIWIGIPGIIFTWASIRLRKEEELLEELKKKEKNAGI